MSCTSDVLFFTSGKQTLDGQEIDLPPALLGKYGNDKSKKTVLLYAHYDVQPVSFYLGSGISEFN